MLLAFRHMTARKFVDKPENKNIPHIKYQWAVRAGSLATTEIGWFPWKQSVNDTPAAPKCYACRVPIIYAVSGTTASVTCVNQLPCHIYCVPWLHSTGTPYPMNTISLPVSTTCYYHTIKSTITTITLILLLLQ